MKLRIKEILKDKSINDKRGSIVLLAKEVGITQPSMSNIVNGKTSPSLKTLEKIAEVLDVEIEELFTSSIPQDKITALIDYRGQLFKANTIHELKEIINRLENKNDFKTY